MFFLRARRVIGVLAIFREVRVARALRMLRMVGIARGV